MIDIFISYSRRNLLVAERIERALFEEGRNVFLDRRIPAGAEWNEDILRALRGAQCVLVLWSEASKDSIWVLGEAAYAVERGTYLPLSIDDTVPPKLFQHIQAPSIARWRREECDDELVLLKQRILHQFGPLPVHSTIEPVLPGDPVDESHLHLVDSCFRVDKPTEYGVMPYQIHVIVLGHETALARIEKVEYWLPEYPEGHRHQVGGSREGRFALKQLANGYSVVQADVYLNDQPAGHRKIIRLSRFVIMNEMGPRFGNDLRYGAQS